MFRVKYSAVIAPIFWVIVLVVSISNNIYPHCQIPCGIYDDERIFSELFQDITTIQKSVSSLLEIEKSREKEKDKEKRKNIKMRHTNQISRWVRNKEEHATNIQNKITHYFLTQRIKPAEKSQYTAVLKDAHQVLRAAMKTKQTIDLEAVSMLKKSMQDFQETYKKR